MNSLFVTRSLRFAYIAMSIAPAILVLSRPSVEVLNEATQQRIYGADVGAPGACNGQAQTNRCGNATTDCTVPNSNNLCDEDSIGVSCNGGLYKGNGSAFACYPTSGNSRCVALGNVDELQECTATTVCICRKPLVGAPTCKAEDLEWTVKESHVSSTSFCTPQE